MYLLVHIFLRMHTVFLISSMGFLSHPTTSGCGTIFRNKTLLVVCTMPILPFFFKADLLIIQKQNFIQLKTLQSSQMGTRLKSVNATTQADVPGGFWETSVPLAHTYHSSSLLPPLCLNHRHETRTCNNQLTTMR